MTPIALWQNIGAGENFFTKVVRFFFLVVAAAVLCFLAVLPLNWMQQAVLGLLSLIVALILVRGSDSYLVTLTLMMLSIFSTLRYGYWRVDQVVRFLHDPANHWGALDVFFIFCLLFAEAYAFVILFLGYFQTIWPLRRAPVALPEDPEDWPDIDVLIPTYNEPLDVVRYTALGALNMDWPVDKLHIYLLDDGRRKEFEEFAHEAGIGYRTRPNNTCAKAGNINEALKTISSPLIAIFDSDHVPTRSFLQMTVGWFFRDPQLAVLQTPHHFYSPDPFERNLRQFRVIPNEGELFYGVVQDGNDFWNSSFFCGSCAVLRREALDEIGGIATETVTEDAHTSLRMQMKGWNTAYINIPQAAGLATERLSAHIGQRIRWARGMIQVMRMENPLFAPGLRFAQRLCYFNAMGHFLYAVPRLIFLTAPLIFLLFNHTNIPGYWAAILAYALPHLALSNLTNSRIQGEHRHSFWNEIYETVLSPYILLPTLMALISPRIGKFNVTAKGGVVRRTFFDSRIAQPFLVMLLFNIAGLIVAIPRFFLWDTSRRGTVLMNVAWCCFNIVILGVCTAVARELIQRRAAVRIRIMTPLAVKLADGRSITGETVDMSNGGAGIRLSEALSGDLPQQVRLVFPLPSIETGLPASVVSLDDSILRVRFEELSLAEQEILTIVLYSRADSWLGWGESRDTDNVLRSLGHIFQVSMRGLRDTFVSIVKGRDHSRDKSTPLSIAGSASILFLTVALAGISAKTLAQSQNTQPISHTVSNSMNPAGAAHPANLANSTNFTSPASSSNSTNSAGSANVANPANAPVPAGQYHDTFTLADAGSPQIELHSIYRKHSVYFTLPETHVPRVAKIHIDYAFSPALIPQLSQLRLSLNGTVFTTIQPTPGKFGGSDPGNQEAEFNIPPDLLVHMNTLSFEFMGHYTMTCEDPANTALWARVHRNTYIDIRGDLLPLADDLKSLPTPFVDPAVVQPLDLPVVFPAQPSLKAIQAAGIVTSYFGLVSENRPVRFPVHIGAIPPGNVILIAENPASIPAHLNVPAVTAPTVAIRTNPGDPYGKVLIVTGPGADDAVIAAQAVALHSDMLNGPQVSIARITLPDKQPPDGAPRWAVTNARISLWDLATAQELQGDGTAPLEAYFRIPPDLYYETDGPNAKLHLVYQYNSTPIGPISSMQVRLNDAFLGSVPLYPGQDTAPIPPQLDMAVPVVNLRPFSNTLSFDFTFQLLKKANNCQDTTPINMQGAILRDSYLDLHGYPHWAVLPNLELFSNAGFPFTRYADLSETTVVLPPAPTPQEIETFVTLMGHFGRQTGFPGLRVSVAGPNALHSGANTDFLIIGSDSDQPAFSALTEHLPVSLTSGQVQVRDTQGFFVRILHSAWWKLQSNQHTESGMLAAGGTPDALIEGIESPYDEAASRSIVSIHLKDASTFEPFMSTFLATQQSSDIAGSVAVLHGTQFQSFRMGSQVYHVGTLPWWTSLTLWFTQVPWLAALLVLVFAFLLAVWVRQWLRARARARLTMMLD
jgi:cellulose synthase (UDP-forming)